MGAEADPGISIESCAVKSRKNWTVGVEEGWDSCLL